MTTEKKTSRRGRPPIENPRKSKILVLFNDEEMRKVEGAYVKTQKLNPERKLSHSAFLREMVLQTI